MLAVHIAWTTAGGRSSLAPATPLLLLVPGARVPLAQSGLCRAQQKPARCATGNCPPALKHNQPQVPAQLSAAYSEDELLPHTLTRLPLLAWLSARPSPSPAVPSLRSVFSRTLGLRLSPPTLLLSTALPEAPTEGILAQSPGASFPVPVQGTVLITALHPAA